MVLVGAALARLSVSGSYTNYVKPGLGIPLLCAGVAVLGLGLWTLVADSTRAGPGQDQERHSHSHSAPRVAWLLCLPVFALYVVAPPALGSYAANLDSVSVTDPDWDAYPPLPRGDPVDITLVDFTIRAVWDNGDTLAHRRVRIIGFVTPRGDGTWDLTRLQMTCCAADVRSNRVQAVGADPEPADTWVRVIGHWIPGGGTKRGDAVPLLEIESVEVIDQPRQPYEF